MPPVVILETCVRPSKSRTVFQNKKISGASEQKAVGRVLIKLRRPMSAFGGKADIM
jgi:hypothetical protein